MAVPLCTQKLRAEFCAHLEKGSYMNEAAVACGIAPSTVKMWMQKGLSDKPGDRPYRLFRKAVLRAKGKAVTTLVAKVHDAAEEDWKAAMALLSARYPKQWGRRPRTVVINSSSTIINQDMPQEELNRQFVEILRSPDIIKGLPQHERQLLLQMAKEFGTEQQEVIDAEFSDSIEGSAEGRPEFHPEGVAQECEGPEDGGPMVGPGR